MPYIWKNEHSEALANLKNALTSSPVMRIPDPNLPFVLICDASNFALGGVLMQNFGDGLQPVGFESKKLHGAELNYPPRDREFLAMKHCAIKWRHVLHKIGRAHV